MSESGGLKQCASGRLWSLCGWWGSIVSWPHHCCCALCLTANGGDHLIEERDDPFLTPSRHLFYLQDKQNEASEEDKERLAECDSISKDQEMPSMIMTFYHICYLIVFITY